MIVTAGTHVGPFYEPWAKERQLRFLDRWLKDDANGAENDPPVRLAVRVGTGIAWRDESESEVEFTGPMAARLWVSSTGHDLDVFLHFRVVERTRAIRVGVWPQGAPIRLAMGWLRASHRELDLDRSLRLGQRG